MTITLKVDTRELDKLIKDSGQTAEEIMTALAFEIESFAKQNAPVDTSALQNSIYTVTKKSSGYDAAAAAVQSLRPFSATAAHPAPTGKNIAHVGPCIEYAGYVELGTSRMAARPYLRSAVETIVQKVNDGETWRKLFG